jgi:glutathione S-transferase
MRRGAEGSANAAECQEERGRAIVTKTCLRSSILPVASLAFIRERPMPNDREITFFHSPQSRSGGTLVLLEELGAPYQLRLLNMKAGENRQAAYLAINPLGKVPAILDGDALITEQCAIYIHLADRFGAAGLAPALDDPLRGPYLRWIVFYGSSFEPAMVDRAMKREPAPKAMSPYGDYDSVVNIIVAQLQKAPYLLGERFSAADILWGGALGWMTAFKLVPEAPPIMDYVKRVTSRPAFVKMTKEDAERAAQHKAAAEAANS